MKSITKRGRRRLIVLAALAAFAVLVFVSANIPAVAETFFARGVTRGLGYALHFVTNYIPISFYEWTALLLIAGGIALLVGIIILLCKKRWPRLLGWLYRLGVAVLCVLIAFGLLYSPLYNRASVISALGLTPTEVTEEKLYAAAEYYVEELNAVSAKLSRDEEENVVPGHSFEELADILNGEFEKQEGDCFAGWEVRPKKVVMSVPMSYLGITGIYFPFYAEANVNVNIPPSQLGVTMAHEMAHAKGVAVEGEANIVAYVLCIRSNDDYLRYCGLMRAAARLLNDLPEEDFQTLYARLGDEVKREYRNESAHFAKYEGAIDRISSFFNDLFLKANGVEGGTQSYSATAASLVYLYEQISA